MTKEIINELVLNAVRWLSNILVEVLGSYGHKIPVAARNHLSKAVLELSEIRECFKEEIKQ